jgi:anti-sigma-K factor RskA
MRLSPAAAEALAAEYVLGTLRARARQRFEALARSDRTLGALVRRWEDALTPLAQAVPAIEPPRRVWEQIEERTRGREEHPGFWSNVRFWRSFGLVAGGLASVLVAAFLWLSISTRGDPMFVAVLTAPDSVPRMVVSMHPPDQLRVRMVKPWAGMEGRSLELWVLPKEGPPRSLGLVHNGMGDTMIRVAATDPRVQGANALAVSMEPPGGSPTGRPTGALVCHGMIAPVKRA